MRHDADLTVPAYCNGPARSGNGGYVAGLLSDRLPHQPGTPVEVTLRQPPPLEVALSVSHADEGREGREGTVLALGDVVVAEALRVDRRLVTVEAVPAEEADAAAARFAGLAGHPFPTCFVCGPQRAEGDGLRIFPGPVGAGDKVAAAWTPHPGHAESSDVVDGVQRVGIGVAWAAMDCIGGWSTDLVGRPMVLGRITASVDALPVVGEQHVLVGVMLGRDGRKTRTASTAYDSDGRIVARAEHVWIEVDPAAFRP